MLGYGYWQRRFGGDRSVIGRSIHVESPPREIVGVMPQGFRVVNADADLIVPLAFDRSRLILAGFGFQGIARLKPGVTIAQANADLARLLPIWMNSWPNGPGANPRVYETWRITPTLRPLKQEVVGNVGGVLWVVMGTIGIVMLIACANVANLLLVRAEARQQELAVRAALGAGWGRIVGELLLESVLLGCIGGVLGLGLAYAGLRFLVAIGPANLPRLNEISIDPRRSRSLCCVSLFSGLLFGLIPALKYAGPANFHWRFAAAAAPLSQSRERHRTRNILVVAQVALALVLLVSAGLDDSHVPGTANGRAGIHSRRSNSKPCESPIPVLADPGPGTSHANPERHSRQAGGDSGRDLRRLCERDADGRRRPRLGRHLRRRTRPYRDGEIPPLAPLQICLARVLSHRRHTIDCRPRLHLDRSLRSQTGRRSFPRISRAKCGARPRPRSGKRIRAVLPGSRGGR